MTKATFLKLEAIFAEAGEAGQLLHQMGASEGGAGNLSVCVREPLDVREMFPLEEQVSLPLDTPNLAGMMLIATGSGCRLRDIKENPTANLGCLLVNRDGKTGQLFTSQDRQFSKLTSEFNTHLAVHHHEMAAGSLNFHAVVHAQPPHITYLSHIERYQNQTFFNQRLFRWEPETIFQFPQGFGMTRYQEPGSPEIEAVTSEAMREHTLVVWAKHGVIARSSISLMQAFDRIEYAEAAAHFEYLNLAAGEPAGGLSVQEILNLCERYNIKQAVY